MALLQLGLPFALARDLFDPQDTAIKKAVSDRLKRSTMLGAIAELPRLLDRYHELAAPYRRLENLFQDDRLKLTFTTAGLDFRKLMDEGWIVLVNTAPRDQHDEAATLFTRLLVKSLFMAAKQREASDDPPPFFLAIDEASRYLTTDTARILAETAKYGLYLLVGMQSLEQAKLENEESYVSLRANVNGEIVMRLLDYDEKLYFARRFFGDHLDFETVKYEETHTAAIPRTAYHTDQVRSRPLGPSYTYREGGRGGTITQAPGTITETGGYHVEYDYETTTSKTFYTPDELERLEARRFSQAQRFGIARVNDQLPTEIEIPELDPPLYSRQEMAAWLRAVKATQPATLPLIDARSRFDARHREAIQLLTGRGEPASIPHPHDDQPQRITLKPGPRPAKARTPGPEG